jgi:hypothetical protein
MLAMILIRRKEVIHTVPFDSTAKGGAKSKLD